ncbi:hypothetical protein RB195_002042 [Necator americanus]|uniref:Uncharacterized protein n=1 Tax=Necator americanus TaxID=51031 RepID=A0ABR1DH46_NECAM
MTDLKSFDQQLSSAIFGEYTDSFLTGDHMITTPHFLIHGLEHLNIGPANARTLDSRRRCVYVLLSTSRRCRHTNESGVQSTTTTSALTSPQQSYHSHIYRSIPTPIVIDSF